MSFLPKRRIGTPFLSPSVVAFSPCTAPSGIQLSSASIKVKGETIAPTSTAKFLGVVLDSRLRYRDHISRTATKGLKAAIALKRLKVLSPSTARQLFNATVAYL
jgi:hypothetical protein